MRFFTVGIPALAAALLASTIPDGVHALDIGETCITPGGVGCGDFITKVEGHILGTILLGSFAGFLAAMIIFYGFKLLVGSNDEAQQGEVKTALVYATIGALLVGGYAVLQASLGTPGNFQPGGLAAALFTVETFLFALVEIALVINLVFQGFRLVTAQEDGQVATARKRFIQGLTGAAVVVVAHLSSFVSEFDVFYSGGGDSSVVAAEIAGVAMFLAVVFGALALVAIIVGGIMLIVSADESLKETAKRTIIGALIALIIVLLGYAFINFFVTLETSS